MDKITISVIIPTHNRVGLLKRAIESVLNQTRKPEEVIVVDDLNDVATKELCEQYFSSGVIYIPNIKGRGASSSRNLGASKAKSEFVAFLDDDDIWRSEEHTSELQSRGHLVCRLLLEKKKSSWPARLSQSE